MLHLLFRGAQRQRDAALAQPLGQLEQQFRPGRIQVVDAAGGQQDELQPSFVALEFQHRVLQRCGSDEIQGRIETQDAYRLMHRRQPEAFRIAQRAVFVQAHDRHARLHAAVQMQA